MGHAIGRLDFAKDTPKEKIAKICNEWEYDNKDLEESCGEIVGIGNQIRYFTDKVYENTKQAEQALDRLTQGKFYPQIAVLYHCSIRNSVRWLVHLETHC